MAATQLGIYNGALLALGERRLSSVAEDTEARRELDGAYADVLAECLAAGGWNFAMETVQVDADTGVTPSFGFRNVFAKPSDWVRTHALSDDEYFGAPLTQYYDDVNFWSSDANPIYVRYVSNDTGLGLEMTRWPRMFTRFVELELAVRVCERLTQNTSLRERLEKDRDKARRTALNHDTMNEAQPKFMPSGSFTRSRWGAVGGDRGNRNRLIG